MIEHPFISDLGQLTLDQLQSKIGDLTKKLHFAHRTGNQNLVNQLNMVLESYNNEFKKKLAETYPKDTGNKYSDKIDIS